MFACQTNQRVGLDHMVYSVCQYVLGKKKNCFQKMFLKNNNKLFCNEATKDQDTEAKK